MGQNSVGKAGLFVRLLRERHAGFLRAGLRHSSGARGEMNEGRQRLSGLRDPTGGLIKEIDVLWINAGLSCDGDTIAMTSAMQPSIEDLVLGALPWIPKVNFHNLFLDQHYLGYPTHY
jgi:hypothetical protein